MSASDYILPSRPLFFFPFLCGVSTGCGCTAEENQMIIATYQENFSEVFAEPHRLNLNIHC